MAPFTPFLAEELYQKLTGGESVHLRDWPEVGHVDGAIVSDMEELRTGINQGLAERAKAAIKVRQPLASAVFTPANAFAQEHVAQFVEIAKEELNVKRVVLKDNPGTDGLRFELDLKLTPVLKREGMAREVIRNIQSARKQAGLNVDDRITLLLATDDVELSKAITEHEDTIAQETLAVDLVTGAPRESSQEVIVEGRKLQFSLSKA
jgi:isoleucyl-tRNA synthetase